MIIIEELPAEQCQECKKYAELRPYGRKGANGIRLWVCYECGMKDRPEAERAFKERLEGKNPIS